MLLADAYSGSFLSNNLSKFVLNRFYRKHVSHRQYWGTGKRKQGDYYLLPKRILMQSCNFCGNVTNEIIRASYMMLREYNTMFHVTALAG